MTKVFLVNIVLFGSNVSFIYFLSLADNYRHRVYTGKDKGYRHINANLVGIILTYFPRLFFF